jgi:ABC-type Mn2+/Zn2+ transport system permease subunit
VLPGIVLAYVMGIPLAIGAFVSGLLCAVGTGFVKSHSRVKEDTVMGVIFTGLFALGLVMFTKIDSDRHLNHILFGSLLGIPESQILQAVVIGGFTLVVTLAMRKDLLLFCFDPAHAQSVGINIAFLNYLMLGLLSLTIVASLQAVGVILVVAMLVTPGSIGFLMTDRFGRMQAIAVAAAVVSSVAGIYISFFLDASTGACIVLVQAVLFALALVFSPKRGLLAARKSAGRALLAAARPASPGN